MNKENCALNLVDDIILYYDARSKKHVWCVSIYTFSVASNNIYQWLRIARRSSSLTLGDNIYALISIYGKNHGNRAGDVTHKPNSDLTTSRCVASNNWVAFEFSTPSALQHIKDDNLRDIAGKHNIIWCATTASTFMQDTNSISLSMVMLYP